MDLAQRYGIESKEELDDLKMMQSAFSPGNTLTKEQIDLLNDGKLDEYMRTLGQVPGISDEPTIQPTVPVTTSATGFIESVADTVVRQTQGTGIHPEVAVAMAALETGWGKHVKGDNYFGIKGKGQKFTTHEFIDGKKVKMDDEFKEFSGFDGSVAGLVDFLKTNPRYSEALKAKTPQEQAKALQDAGYATDPRYAEKLISIMKRVDKVI
jgi:flagellum-specific peptidoglycan hydrolase FlgJ